MKLKAVLFDLDGTLLPMDQDEFTKGYFGLLAKKMAPLGYEPKELIDAVWSGTAEMMKNDGVQSNESVFWQKFAEKLGLAPDECLMAGNDVWEDMQAQNTGMNVFLLTACLINKKNEDISAYPQGGFKELEAFAKKLCK